ncbi:MAG TPA: hypothetical protein VFG21_06220 [Xanthomonadaceae bacterium]|nr:hypothetical protein [Xanthomonadaceae bacterium]
MKRLRVGIALVLVVVLVAAGLVLGAAPRPVPWRPAESMAIAPEQWQLHYADRVVDEGAIYLEGAAPDGSSLLVLAEPALLEAAHWRYLQVSFPEFPDTLRLALLFRRQGGARSALVSLPQPDADTTIDLGRLPGWEGRIESFGLAVLPAELVPGDAVRGRRHELGSAALHTDARSLAVASMVHEWCAPRGWSGRSINAAGRELAYWPIQPWLPFLVGCAVLTWAALVWALRWRGRRLYGSAAAAALALWLVLDLIQLRILAHRADAAASMLAAAGRDRIAVEPALSAHLAQLRQWIAGTHPDARVVLLAQDAFTRSYGAFGLMPLDVGAPAAAAPGALRPGDLVVRIGTIGELDAPGRRFRLATRDYRIEPTSAPVPWPVFVIAGQVP